MKVNLTNKNVTLVQGALLHVPSGSHVLLVLRKLAINELYSKDFLSNKKREGVLRIKTNDQERTLQWRTIKDPDNKKKVIIANPQDIEDYLVFLGKQGDIDLDVAVVEVDKKPDAKDVVANVGKMLSGFSSVASMFPGPGTAVAAGLGIAAKITDLVRANADDDLELGFIGTAPKQETGRSFELRRGEVVLDDQRVPGLIVHFDVIPLRALPSTDQRMGRVTIEGLEADIDLKEVFGPAAVEELRERGFSERAFIKDLLLSLDLALGGGEEADTLAIDERLGTGKKQLDEVYSIEKGTVLHEGSINAGIPYNLAITVNDADKGGEVAQASKALLQEATSRLKTLAAPDDADKKAVWESRLEKTTAAAQSFREVLLASLKKSLSVAAVSGIIVHEDSLKTSDVNLKPPRYLTLPDTNFEAGTALYRLSFAYRRPPNGDDDAKDAIVVTLSLKVERVPAKIDQSKLPEATVGKDFSANLTASSVVESLTWTSDDLPRWLTLKPWGKLVGKPASGDESDSVAFHVNVVDSSPNAMGGRNEVKNHELTIRVRPA